MDTSSTPESSRSGCITPAGCGITALVVVLLVAIAGYFAYQRFKDIVEMPEDLQAFSHPDSVRSRITSRAQAPGDSTRLDSSWVRFYLDGADSVGRGIDEIRRSIDSMRLEGGDSAEGGIAILMSTPKLIKGVMMLKPLAQQSLVAYLNRTGRSLAEYEWAKTRTIAASGIEPEEVDSVVRSVLKMYLSKFGPGATKEIDSSTNEGSVAIAPAMELRRSGAIDSSEIALASPHRRRLVTTGLGSLLGLDDPSEPAPDISITPKDTSWGTDTSADR